MDHFRGAAPLKSEISRETIDEIRATDESRVFEKAKNAHLLRNDDLWLLDSKRTRFSNIAEGVAMEPDVHPENTPVWQSRDSFPAVHDGFSTGLNSYQTEPEAVHRRLELISTELQFVNKQLSTVDEKEGVDLDNMAFLLDRRHELESRLKGERQKLKSLIQKSIIYNNVLPAAA